MLLKRGSLRCPVPKQNSYKRKHIRADGWPVISINGQRIVEFAAKNRLPAIYPSSQFIDFGGLMFYGVSFNFRQPFPSSENAGWLLRRKTVEAIMRFLKQRYPNMIQQTPQADEFKLQLRDSLLRETMNSCAVRLPDTPTFTPAAIKTRWSTSSRAARSNCCCSLPKVKSVSLPSIAGEIFSVSYVYPA
jgi:hypothetical protein